MARRNDNHDTPNDDMETEELNMCRDEYPNYVSGTMNCNPLSVGRCTTVISKSTSDVEVSTSVDVHDPSGGSEDDVTCNNAEEETEEVGVSGKNGSVGDVMDGGCSDASVYHHKKRYGVPVRGYSNDLSSIEVTLNNEVINESFDNEFSPCEDSQDGGTSSNNVCNDDLIMISDNCQTDSVVQSEELYGAVPGGHSDCVGSDEMVLDENETYSGDTENMVADSFFEEKGSEEETFDENSIKEENPILSDEEIDIHDEVICDTKESYLCKTEGVDLDVADVFEKSVAQQMESGNGNYQCPLCSLKYKTKNYFSKHLRTSHPERLLYRCEKCGLGFVLMQSLEKHMIRHVTGNEDFKCDVCGATYLSKRTLRKHACRGRIDDLPSRSPSNSVCCDVCGKKYSRKDTLKRHIAEVHSDLFSKPQADDSCPICKICGKTLEDKFVLAAHEFEHKNPPYECNICQAVFKGVRYLKEHVKLHLEGKPSCNICGRAMASLKNLKRQILLHKNEINFLCEFCGKGFNYRQKFTLHMRCHTNVPINKPLKCTVCHKAFRDKTNLAAHMNKHTGDRSFICNICGKGLGDKRTLKMHEARHTGENQYKCPICSKTFAYSSYRTSHMRSHTKEKPFKCQECDKCFSQKSSLNTHMRSHTGEKKHVCSVCQKAFLHLHYMQVHMRSHTGEKPYKCLTCQKGFSQKGSLNLHMRNCQ